MSFHLCLTNHNAMEHIIKFYQLTFFITFLQAQMIQIPFKWCKLVFEISRILIPTQRCHGCFYRSREQKYILRLAKFCCFSSFTITNKYLRLMVESMEPNFVVKAKHIELNNIKLFSNSKSAFKSFTHQLKCQNLKESRVMKTKAQFYQKYNKISTFQGN